MKVAHTDMISISGVQQQLQGSLDMHNQPTTETYSIQAPHPHNSQQEVAHPYENTDQQYVQI